MSKEEQFEHIENKIKQAITDEQPAFDEKAWVKMEALLDKEEKKRRPFLWLWFLLPLLLAGAGSVLYFTNHKSVDQNFDKNISNITDSKKNIPGASDKKELKEQTTVENIQPEKNISSLKESETDVQDVQLKEENKIVARKKRPITKGILINR